MATTGQVSPTYAINAAEAPWFGRQWNTPLNVLSDNDLTANIIHPAFDNGVRSYALKAYIFDGFSVIPDNATINGVICRVNTWYRAGQGSGSLGLCQLLDPEGTRAGLNQCASPIALTTDNTTIITRGSSTDTWWNLLTPDWVKNPMFGVALGVIATADNADVDIDYVTLEIYYTVPAAAVDDPHLRFTIGYRT